MLLFIPKSGIHVIIVFFVCLFLFFSPTPFVSILMKSCGLSDYVCVLDLGMFELSLLTCDGSEKVKKKKKISPIPLCNLLNVSHCYSGFPLNVESNFECFLFACLRLVISLTNSASFSQPMRCIATNSADSPMCAARSHFCYFSFPISRTL